MTARLREKLRSSPEGFEHSLGRVLLINGGLMMTVLLAALDQTIVATALPHIVGDVGGLTSYSWVFSGYLLFQTVGVPIYAKLGDIHGRRRLILVSIAIFLAGSALCSVAQSMTQLIVFRCVQGMGAGGLSPLATAAVAELIPPRARGRFQGVTASAFACASLIGPAVGGLIVDHTTWRWIFYVNLPLGALALAVIGKTMPDPRDRRRSHSIDYVGATLLAVATASLLLGLLWGGRAHAWGSLHVVGALAGSVLVFGSFARWERRARETIIPFDVLRSSTVAACAVGIGLASAVQFGLITFMPLFAQGALGVSATASGVVLTPLVLGTALSSVVGGQVVSHTGRYRPSMLAAPIVLAAGIALLLRLDTASTTFQAGAYMFAAGIGFGLMLPLFLVAAQNAAPLSTIGATTGIVHFLRSIGTTLGPAVFGVIVNQRLPAAVRGGLVAHSLPQPARVQLAAAIRPALLTAIGVCLVLFLIVARGVRDERLRHTIDVGDAAEALE